MRLESTTFCVKKLLHFAFLKYALEKFLNFVLQEFAFAYYALKKLLFVSLHFALERYQILRYTLCFRKVTTFCVKKNFSNKNNSNTSILHLNFTGFFLRYYRTVVKCAPNYPPACNCRGN